MRGRALAVQFTDRRSSAGLLGGEAGGEVGHGVAPSPAIGDLRVGEDAGEESLLPALDDFAHARQVDQIHADAPDGHDAPIRSRITPASSSAIARMRWPSAPSIMTRASGSVPE